MFPNYKASLIFRNLVPALVLPLLSGQKYLPTKVDFPNLGAWAAAPSQATPPGRQDDELRGGAAPFQDDELQEQDKDKGNGERLPPEEDEPLAPARPLLAVEEDQTITGTIEFPTATVEEQRARTFPDKHRESCGAPLAGASPKTSEVVTYGSELGDHGQFGNLFDPNATKCGLGARRFVTRVFGEVFLRAAEDNSASPTGALQLFFGRAKEREMLASSLDSVLWVRCYANASLSRRHRWREHQSYALSPEVWLRDFLADKISTQLNRWSEEQKNLKSGHRPARSALTKVPLLDAYIPKLFSDMVAWERHAGRCKYETEEDSVLRRWAATANGEGGKPPSFFHRLLQEIRTEEYQKVLTRASHPLASQGDDWNFPYGYVAGLAKVSSSTSCIPRTKVTSTNAGSGFLEKLAATARSSDFGEHLRQTVDRQISADAPSVPDEQLLDGPALSADLQDDPPEGLPLQLMSETITRHASAKSWRFAKWKVGKGIGRSGSGVGPNAGTEVLDVEGVEAAMGEAEDHCGSGYVNDSLSYNYYIKSFLNFEYLPKLLHDIKAYERHNLKAKCRKCQTTEAGEDAGDLTAAAPSFFERLLFEELPSNVQVFPIPHTRADVDAAKADQNDQWDFEGATTSDQNDERSAGVAASRRLAPTKKTRERLRLMTDIIADSRYSWRFAKVRVAKGSRVFQEEESSAPGEKAENMKILWGRASHNYRPRPEAWGADAPAPDRSIRIAVEYLRVQKSPVPQSSIYARLIFNFVLEVPRTSALQVLSPWDRGTSLLRLRRLYLHLVKDLGDDPLAEGEETGLGFAFQ
eukprot:g15785.t1